MKLTTSWASAHENAPSENGSRSAGACTTRTPGNRSRQAATNGGDGSAAATCAAPSRRTSSPVSAPGPQPTSSADNPERTPAASHSLRASSRP
jgi:hypothetical protein